MEPQNFDEYDLKKFVPLSKQNISVVKHGCMSKTRVFQIIVDDIPIEVTKKSVKHLRIVAYPSCGKVRISSPKNIPDHEIKKFANSRAGWIKKQLNDPGLKKRKPDPHFHEGSMHYIWGRPHTLILKHGAERFSVEVNDQQEIHMAIQKGCDLHEREPIMREWYRRSIKSRIPGLINKWEPVMDVKVNEWGVKKMKTRWGTCNTRARRIWLNLELAKRDTKVLEYIVVHEMTHLLERPHSRRFYRLMDSFLPNWRTIDRELGGTHWRRC